MSDFGIFEDQDRIPDVAVRADDINQLIGMVEYLLNAFGDDHDADTGRHLRTLAVSDWASEMFSPSNITVPSTVGLFTIGNTPSFSLTPAAGFIRAAMTAASSGIVEVFPMFYGHVDAARTSPGAFRVCALRLTAGSTHSLAHHVYTAQPKSPEWNLDGAVSNAGFYIELTRIYYFLQTQVPLRGQGMDRALWYQLYTGLNNLTAAYSKEHPGNVSEPPSPYRFAQRIIPVPPVVNTGPIVGGDFSFLGAHSGNHHYILPFVRHPSDVRNPEGSMAQWFFLPAFDESNAYLYAGRDATSHDGSRPLNGAPFTVLFRDTNPAAEDLPEYSAQSEVSASDATLPTNLSTLRDNAVRLWKLFGVEHENASGCHAYSIDQLAGAELVLETTITVPLTQSLHHLNWASVSDPDNGTAESDVTNPDCYVITEIETQPTGGGIYLCSAVGLAVGGGIITLSVAVDDTKAYLIARRSDGQVYGVRADSFPNPEPDAPTDFAVRVWRIDP